jgi:amicyanin
VAQIPTGASPHYANWFPGTTLGMAVVQGPSELLLFDPATNMPVRKVQVGKQPHWMTVSGNGKTAYVTNEGSNDVSVVDIATGGITTIAVGKGPRKIVVQPAARGATGGTTGGATGGAKVSIVNFAFAPAHIKIAAGDNVTWINDDGAPHAVAFKDGAAGARSLMPGQTISRTFDRSGDYDYFCSVHPYMTGHVVVESRSEK